MFRYDKLEPGKLVSFNLYPSSLFGNVEHARVEAILDFNTAVALGFDPVALHIRAYPTLDGAVDNNAESYQYVKLRKGDSTFIIGIPWIIEDTIITHEYITADIRVSNIDLSDVQRLREVLHANGYTSISIKTQ